MYPKSNKYIYGKKELFHLAKLIVMYEEPKDKEGFEKYYLDVHIPLTKKMPNIKNVQVQKVINSQNTNLNLYLIAEVEFENMEALKTAFKSDAGKEAQADLKNLLPYLNSPPITAIVD